MSKIEWEYCAVNCFGWAYGGTMLEALDALGGSFDNKKYYNAKKAKTTLLRIFKFPKGNRPVWVLYCPYWKDNPPAKYWMIEDNMQSDIECPAKLKGEICP